MVHEQGACLVRQALHPFDFYVSVDKMPFLESVSLVCTAQDFPTH